MRGYLLFAGHHYYPNGGMSDLQARGDTPAHLMRHFKSNAKGIAGASYIDNWGQIVDTMTMKVVFAVDGWDGEGEPDWRPLRNDTLPT